MFESTMPVDALGLALLSFWFFWIGASMGSFASAISYRALRGESWVVNQFTQEGGAARSRCPNCDHQLGLIDLVPVLSWIGLRGKCRYCRNPISPVYPFLELVSGLMAAIFFVLDGKFVVSIGFSFLIPFVVALGASLAREPQKVPRSLVVMGLLSLGGMVLLSLA